MSTRLDRLFVLLDSGSTPLIRRSAAEQLGEVVHLHPHELNNLLIKVHGLLRAANWDTRIAACQAVEAIAKNIPQWEPLGAIKTAVDMAENVMSGMVLFSQFDVRRVLTCGASLLGSEGNQYDVAQTVIGMDDKEQLLQQRQLLNKRLGLDAAGALGLDSSALFDDSDLRFTQSTLSSSNNNNSKLLVDFVANELPITSSHMSSRERNVAKRKARSFSKTFTNNGVTPEDACPVKRLKRERSEGSVDSVDSSGTGEELDEWPFQNFCEVLMNDLFHSSWEIRHGAASGLREVIKRHGRGAGKAMDMSQSLLKGMNQLWLSDLAIRLLCVLALDRFGDYVSDEVVAPVRETCAQALGATLKYMDEDAVGTVVSVSLQLLAQKEWEIRHGALLGLKYSLAVRQDMTPKLLPKVLPAIMQGLCDPDDDVRAVAASAVIPVTDALVDCMPAQIPVILTSLWNVLCDLDDLTASTNSIMTLLAKLTANTVTKSSSFMTVSLTELTPRLLPFLRHNITSVRRAALETLLTLLDLHDLQTTCQWMLPIYQETIRHIYQRSFLEEKTELLPMVVRVWQKLLECCLPDHLVIMTVPWLPVWLTILMQPVRVPYDSNLLIEAKHKPRNVQMSTMKAKIQLEARAHIVECKYYIAGCDTNSDNQVETDSAVNQARLTGARLLGMLADRLCQPLTAPIPSMEPVPVAVGKLLSFHLSNKSALQRYVAGHVIYSWALQHKPCPCPEFVQKQLFHCLVEVVYYDEIAYAFTRLQSDCKDFLSSLKQQGINLDSTFPPGQLLTLEMATHLTTEVYKQVRPSLKHTVSNIFDERQKQLTASITSTTQEQQLHSIRVLCSLAMAVVGLDVLPEKLNPVVRPLMDVIKKEENVILQEEAAECLVKLIQACLSRSVNPNAKVVKNLCNFLCSDPTMTPSVNNPTSHIGLPSQGSDQIASCSQFKGILTLVNLQKVTDQSVRRRGRKVNSAMKKENETADLEVDVSGDQAESQENQRQAAIQRQGAEKALCALARSLQVDLSTVLPSLWSTCLSFAKKDESNEADQSSKEGEKEELHVQELVNSLQTLETLIPVLHENLLDQVNDQLKELLKLLSSKWTAVRHISARVVAALSLVHTPKLMPFIIRSVLPLLDSAENETMREGGMETVANVVDKLGLATLPYLVLLIIPVLGRMSDQNISVRMMATHCFATLIRLMPLEAGTPNPPTAEAWLTERKDSERHFLEQLFDTSKLDDYAIAVPVKAELRKYQQDGVNWLGFLNKYKLHGILCDDMGLGKTLQSICILATDHLQREAKFKSSKHIDCSPLPSIVVCPPTLVGHWVYEVKKFIQPTYLNPLMYMGPPAERLRLQKRVQHHNLIIASYEVVRNDIDFFSTIHWNYCILDEGHIIRNGKTKLAKATKQLISNHRLILSGTPIQNNVLDLWSLFDFLMPGFLGTERQFQARYGKPILQSRDAKSSSKEQEAGSLAMESLHRQVLPFILRRLKDDVLKDLPPKIIQDYYCDLSPLQVQLYEDFARSRAKQNVDETVGAEEEIKEKVNHQHIFQSLQYLRKVCNHPALVVNSSHPKWAKINSTLAQNNSELRDISHAPKLTALKQLLNDCCIGLTAPPVSSSSSSSQYVESVPVVNQHRVLLFCQLKSMLDIVEMDLLKTHMPSVSYLRLDGSIPATKRHDIVHRFNSDPSIDILLLTTHVGGLGLNLTGADTVIFVEHDWNPMKDLQAMDRAHRIGQKKVVNVYRLITRGTLEEKIMGLQKFKMAVANTVISQDNSSLHSMGTDQLLDLFVLDEGKEGLGKEDGNGKEEKTGQRKSIHALIEGLEELWDESQYESEYNIDAFMKSLENAK